MKTPEKCDIKVCVIYYTYILSCSGDRLEDGYITLQIIQRIIIWWTETLLTNVSVSKSNSIKMRNTKPPTICPSPSFLVVTTATDIQEELISRRRSANRRSSG